MTNLNRWEPRAWWMHRNALDDLADAAQQLADLWRHYRDWERLMVDDVADAQSEEVQGLLEWHRKRIAAGIGRLRVAHFKAGLQRDDATLGDPPLTGKAMAERYTPWPPMQTTEEAKASAPDDAAQ